MPPRRQHAVLCCVIILSVIMCGQHTTLASSPPPAAPPVRVVPEDHPDTPILDLIHAVIDRVHARHSVNGSFLPAMKVHSRFVLDAGDGDASAETHITQIVHVGASDYSGDTRPAVHPTPPNGKVEVPVVIHAAAGVPNDAVAAAACVEFKTIPNLAAHLDGQCEQAVTAQLQSQRQFPLTVLPDFDALVAHNLDLQRFYLAAFQLEEAIIDAGLSLTEGHTAWCPTKIEFMLRSFQGFRHPPGGNVTVFEVGFNAGHSMLAYLLLAPNVVVVSFDLGEHEYGWVARDVLKQWFGDRVSYFVGDSKVLLPRFMQTYPSRKADVYVVDGDHKGEGALVDILAGQLLVNPTHVVLADDVLSAFPGSHWAWNHAVEHGILEELGRVDGPNYGATASMGAMSWGQYTSATPK